ncbi:MAG: hypothetical protein WCI73_06105 [Phycisphaerae bacterium]
MATPKATWTADELMRHLSKAASARKSKYRSECQPTSLGELATMLDAVGEQLANPWSPPVRTTPIPPLGQLRIILESADTAGLKRGVATRLFPSQDFQDSQVEGKKLAAEFAKIIEETCPDMADSLPPSDWEKKLAWALKAYAKAIWRDVAKNKAKLSAVRPALVTGETKAMSPPKVAALLRGQADALETVKNEIPKAQWRTGVTSHVALKQAARGACGAWAFAIRRNLAAGKYDGWTHHAELGRRVARAPHHRLRLFSLWVMDLPNAREIPAPTVGELGRSGDSWIWALRTLAEHLDATVRPADPTAAAMADLAREMRRERNHKRVEQFYEDLLARSSHPNPLDSTEALAATPATGGKVGKATGAGVVGKTTRESDDEYQSGQWFTLNTSIPTDRLRQAARRRTKRVATKKIGGVVLYRVADARKWWAGDMSKA